ncbi:MAG: hypothetical protein IJP62_03820 [Treponema sp.]|nr:hypothetical protein [Treponema sp.]
MNLLGDLQISDTNNFYYEIYYSKPNGSSESEHKYTNAGADEPVTFSNVKYDTYIFFLKIWVDSSKQTVLNTIQKEVAVSAQNNTVAFPDRSVSEYKNWFFVSTADDLRRAVTTISSDATFSESNKAIICLRDIIELPNYQSILASVSSKAEVKYNGFKIAEQLFNVNISESITGGTVTASHTKGAFGDEITLTVTVAEGWFFFPPTIDGVTITRSEEDPMQFTFDMPAGDVEVTTTFFDAIYVSESGTTENDGLSAEKPVPSIEMAIEKINYYANELNNTGFDWKIKVTGILPESQTIEASMLPVNSLTVVGETGGTIDGNNSDSALTINVTVPVTIKNLTIKNGAGSTDTGGGITISENSTVTIEDGVSIESNTSEQYGGGIHNKGTLTINGGEIKNNTADYYGGGIFNDRGGNIYICGSTVITGNSCSTTLKYGGGIYNSPTGTIYLGYKSQTEKEAWTGSITGNSAVLGGGIWNGATAVLYFDSGTISSNTTTSSTSSDSVELMGNTNNAPALYLSGSATITGGDKIYLSPYSSSNKLATISVDEDIENNISVTMGAQYTAGTQVLTGSAVVSAYTKFSLTNSGVLEIGSDGKLVMKALTDLTRTDMAAMVYGTTGLDAGTDGSTLNGKTILFKTAVGSDFVYLALSITTCSASGCTAAAVYFMPDAEPVTVNFSNRGYIFLATNLSYDMWTIPEDTENSLRINDAGNVWILGTPSYCIIGE